MDNDTLWLAFGFGLAFALVIEGFLPFISPGLWRKVFAQVQALDDGQIRFFGLCSIAAGIVLMLVMF